MTVATRLKHFLYAVENPFREYRVFRLQEAKSCGFNNILDSGLYAPEGMHRNDGITLTGWQRCCFFQSLLWFHSGFILSL